MSVPQTRLGEKLRAEVKQRGVDVEQLGGDGWNALRAAAMLDQAVYSLGRKGLEVRNLGAYMRACRSYRVITGVDYEPTPKGA